MMKAFQTRLRIARICSIVALILVAIAHLLPWERAEPDKNSILYWGRPQFFARYPPMMEATWPAVMPETTSEKVHAFPTWHIWKTVWACKTHYKAVMNGWGLANDEVRNNIGMALCCIVVAIGWIMMPLLVPPLSRMRAFLWLHRFLLLALCGWFARIYIREHLHPKGDPPNHPAAGYWLVVAAVWLQAAGSWVIPNSRKSGVLPADTLNH
ncbi:MAG: hypothetical protein QM755_04965 [Luteolibacter sp.]